MSVHEDTLRFWELLSYIATVIGIPVAVIIYWLDQRRGRVAQQWEIDDQLNKEYNDIIDQFIEHPELDKHDKALEEEDKKNQQYRIYEKLIALFERAYILLADERNPELIRMWHSWEDYISEWLSKPNFKNALDRLLEGEDKDFGAYIRRKAGVKSGLISDVSPAP